MLFAMDSLGKLTEILELKFIQRVESCQIHHHGIDLLASPLATSNQKLIAELAAKNRSPWLYVREDYVNSGGLMSCGADREELFRRGGPLFDYGTNTEMLNSVLYLWILTSVFQNH